MKRRAAGDAAQTAGSGRTMMRVQVKDVYGGMVAGRDLEDETLAPLAASIARHGLLQPIVVRRNAQAGRFALVCGARRLAACRLLGLKEIDALCLELDDAAAAACFMEEHCLRRAPCAMEEALALCAVDKDALLLSTALGRQAIEQRLGLLALPLRVQEIARQRRLSMEQAQPLLSASGEERQTEAALIIAERSLTPAQARRLVFGPQKGRAQSARRRTVRAALEEVGALARRLRAQGVEASVSVHSQEGGMCVQLLFGHAEKRSDQQDFEKKGRNS
ncbi:MAG: ParB/RepB/Spo0J family partition protein [Candidatus Ventricola sp.]